MAVVVDTISQPEAGQSLPPYGPHTITFHCPGWEKLMRFRDGDMSLIMSLKSMYPRFAPFGVSAMFSQAIGKQLSLPEGHMCAGFFSPEVWASNRSHALAAKFRQEHTLDAADFGYHVVDLPLPGGGDSGSEKVRLYMFSFPMSKMQGAIFSWQHAGLGFSTRFSEALGPSVDKSLVYLGQFPNGEGAPEPTYLPEGPSHQKLRERIAEFLARAPAKEIAPGDEVLAKDVFLYQTGMAGIVRTHDVIQTLRPSSTVVVFGAVFHSTYHLFEESDGGIKHYGRCGKAELDEFEEWLAGEGKDKCGYIFTEFPSNPILVSVDLMRLRTLADKYGFFIVVDDTVGSFANVDVLPVADVIVTSLTKSFSGYANVMAGSVALNNGGSSKSAYTQLQPQFQKSHHNELFVDDADALLSNSNDYLTRTAILNRNAATVASYIAACASNPAIPISKIHYPPHTQGTEYLDAFLRRPDANDVLPKAGYGCLLSIEMETMEDTISFYNNLPLFNGPHLGAHRTIAMPYNAGVYGKADSHPEVHAAYGLKQEQIRISVGLEDEEPLLALFRDAVGKMVEAKKEREG